MNNYCAIGRLTKEPELKQTQTGKSVCRFTLAVPRQGQEVDFIPCTAWEKTAEGIKSYVRKGQRIGVEGVLRSNSWEDQNGQKRSSLEVWVNRYTFCEPKPQTEGSQETMFAPVPEGEIPF